jgi:hypothetical protein
MLTTPHSFHAMAADLPISVAAGRLCRHAVPGVATNRNWAHAHRRYSPEIPDATPIDPGSPIRNTEAVEMMAVVSNPSTDDVRSHTISVMVGFLSRLAGFEGKARQGRRCLEGWRIPAPFAIGGGCSCPGYAVTMTRTVRVAGGSKALHPARWDDAGVGLVD